MKEFREFVESHQDKSVARIARLALKLPASALLPVIEHQVEEILRALARGNEQKILRPFLHRLNAMPAGIAPGNSPEVLQVLRQRVALGNGKRVVMMDMTEPQHLERIAFLKSQIAGTEETIQLHQECVDILRREHARTMREVLEQREAA